MGAGFLGQAGDIVELRRAAERLGVGPADGDEVGEQLAGRHPPPQRRLDQVGVHPVAGGEEAAHGQEPAAEGDRALVMPVPATAWPRDGDRVERAIEIFNAGEHPQIVVDFSRISREGDRATAEGTLTVAGRSRPLAVTARVTENSDNAITLAADTEINRADFGMNWNRLGMIKGNAQVSVLARFVR